MSKEEVLNTARLILTQCDYAQTRDKKGYDRFDATTVRKILSIKDIDDGEVEYLRLKLLRYLKQLRKLGKDFNISNKKIEEICKKLENLVAPYSVICDFKTEDGRWHFGLRKLYDMKRLVCPE